MEKEKKTSMGECPRQGDLLFVPVAETTPPRGFEQNKKGVIQEGEATGHHHRLEDLRTATVYRGTPQAWAGQGSAYVFTGESGATVVHEEHKPVKLAPRTRYKVEIAKEYDYTERHSRQVMD